MSRIGYHTHKILLADELQTLLNRYFFAFHMPTHIEFKIVFEIVDDHYFKIINKASNIVSGRTQEEYKKLMIKVFRYMLPTKHYEEIDSHKAFLKVYDLDPATIMKYFKQLEHSKKCAKYKQIHSFKGSMSYKEDFRQFILELLKVTETTMDETICTASDLISATRRRP